MYCRLVVGLPLAIVLVTGGVPLPSAVTHSFVGNCFLPAAQAKSRVRNMLDRVLGRNMPEGIFKTNGRIEATQVDVAAKYPGRLVDITVEEGSEVKAGQVVGRISSPEYEAQLRSAQSNVDLERRLLVASGVEHRESEEQRRRCHDEAKDAERRQHDHGCCRGWGRRAGFLFQ